MLLANAARQVCVIVRRSAALGLAGLCLAAPALASSAPAGVFLLYSDQRTAPSAEDCAEFVARTRPSVDKAEAWYWGRAPLGSDLEFYLFLDNDRMESTFSAEGDYDYGDLLNVRTNGEETTFELVPDDHPSIRISGTFFYSRDSRILTVVLRGIPGNGNMSDRTAYYCSFKAETEL